MFNIAIRSHVQLIFNQCIIRNQHFVHSCQANSPKLDEWKEFLEVIEAFVVATRIITTSSSLYPMSNSMQLVFAFGISRRDTLAKN